MLAEENDRTEDAMEGSKENRTEARNKGKKEKILTSTKIMLDIRYLTYNNIHYITTNDHYLRTHEQHTQKQ